ncbi:MAG: OmpH family outer membrane protein [Planctomycetes bacterium]|nr:OmpH family outer membrane protein [Planctomycetota bacterium]
MKRFAKLSFVLAIAVASYGASWLQHSSQEQPEIVHAQDVKVEGVRIGLFNLEEASRHSALFKRYKIDWERTQEELKNSNLRMRTSYETKNAELKRARAEGKDQRVLDLRIELQSLEEAIKAAAEEQKKYLASLLNQYQTAVIQHVMNVAEQYAIRQGYDLVLQDYRVSAEDADFFSGGGYAQSMMSKPVLIAPGVISNKNAHVTDITGAVSQLVQVGGNPQPKPVEPPKPKDDEDDG